MENKMSVGYGDKDVSNVLEKIEGLHDARWSGFEDKIVAMKFSHAEFLAYCFSKEVRSLFAAEVGYRYSWINTEVVSYYCMEYQDVGKKILNDPSDSDLVNGYIRSLAFNPLRDYNRLVNSNSADIRVVAAQFCSFDQLISLKNDASKKVRKVVYGRLGPVGHIDDMLSDRSADIRSIGISLAPFGHKKLSSMVNEIARSVFAGLILKIAREDLPLLLTNRNLKDKWILSKFEQRMNSSY
jgi:hypothetical protein